MTRAGLSAIEITPPPNVPLDGFETRKTGSQGVHDPLFARAAVFDDGSARIAWLVADLVGLPAATTAAVRNLVSVRTGIPGDRVMVSCTHTHGGPSPRPRPEVECNHVGHGKWLAALPGVLADAVARASGKVEPVEILVGRADCTEVQHNRRFHMKDGSVKMVWDDPDPAKVARLGPVDPVLRAVVIRSGSKLRGVLAHFACHPTAVTGANFLVTADWPGVVCRDLPRKLGVPGLWVAVAQGCCGDITPSPPRGTFDVCEEKGVIVTRAVVRAVADAGSAGSVPVGSARIPVRLPMKMAGPNASPTGEHYAGEVQALRIGDVAAVGLPGEPFVWIGLQIGKETGFRAILAGGYTNDYDDSGLGYIPTKDEYGGGYEPGASRIAPGGDELLVAAARAALGRLR